MATNCGKSPGSVAGMATASPAAVIIDQHDSDPALLARIARGDLTAVGPLYDRYSGSLLAVASRIVGARGDAEDVVHDAFVFVVDRAGQYHDTRGSVAAWLVTVTRNLAIDRARGRVRRASLAEGIAVHFTPAATEAPDEAVASSRTRAKVRRALADLPESHRRALEIAFWDGLSYREIAARERVPVGTIKSRAARAMAAMRTALA
jgi:RNA polymerase sigma-70 factor (ECF subfamily)